MKATRCAASSRLSGLSRFLVSAAASTKRREVLDWSYVALIA
jgi:hypothetical protein